MTTPTITDYLKYANLQMAAESFIRDPATGVLNGSGTELINALVRGNDHSSKFTQTQAKQFTDPVEGWTVLDQRANTSTGFSGTLFKNNKTGELVISMRSTEFIDDAARDNLATNTDEIKNTGWAWGQIADMEAWYKELNATAANGTPGPLNGKTFNVTGYSLGGHLATAFNLLRREDDTQSHIGQVVTFNGAGVGEVKQGTLSAALQNFQDLRAHPDQIIATFNDPGLANAYRTIRAGLAQGGTIADAESVLKRLSFSPYIYNENQIAELNVKKQKIADSLGEIKFLIAEAARVGNLKAGGEGPGANGSPVRVPDSLIEAEGLDYRMAVQLAAQRTNPATLLGGLARAYTGKVALYPAQANQYDVVGDTSPSAVANSQWHYGTDVRIAIEDQPLFRGGIGATALGASLDFGDVTLLVNGYARKDFGDTHSLVLLVDSLNVQNILLQLLPEDQRTTPAAALALKTIFKEASYLKREDGALVLGDYQGKAEGNVLENLVSALGNLLLGPENYKALIGNPNGGTWANLEDSGDAENPYDGRKTFYETIKSIGESTAYKALASTLTLSPSTAALKDTARTDFTAFAATFSLSPFRIGIGSGGDAAALENILGTAWGQTYKDWTSDKLLTAAERTAGKGNFSDTWLADRSRFLGYWLTAGDTNTDTLTGVANTGLSDTSQLVLKDLASSQKISVMSDTPSAGQSSSDKESQYLVFGGKGVDVLQGGKLNDHFYGGLGTDYLAGKGGDDYLEGGSGLDLYNYVASSTSDDVKINDGNDTIHDTDGKGVLRYTYADSAGKTQSTVIAEASTKLSDTQWQSADGKFTYTKDGTDLVVTMNGDAGGKLTLKDFKDGDYSIHLREARTAPQTVRTIVGDKKPQDFDPVADGIQSKTDGVLGNVITTDEAEPDRADTLYGSADADRIDGLGGPDAIYGFGGDDWIIGGAGDDQIDAGAGNDLVEAGADSDMVDGGDGNDELYADKKISLKDAINQGNVDNPTNVTGDNLSGGEGSNWLIGGRGNDYLHGGTGADLIVGGAGDDNMEGDLMSWAKQGWTVIRSEEKLNGRVVEFTMTCHEMTFADGQDVDVGGADVFYGGSGRDWIYGRGGDDFIDGGDGNDDLSGGSGSDILIGGSGNDVLLGDKTNKTYASDGADYLDGGDGDDTLWGNGGDDILIGGKGNDYLNGGAGRDIYVFNKGDGVEIIDDTPNDPKKYKDEASVIVFGEGINKQDVKFGKGSLLIDLGASDANDPTSKHDAIHFQGFDYANPEATPMIGELRFFDGQVMTYADILAQGFDINGTDGDDDDHDIDHARLVGTGVTDRIRGYGGNDVLVGLRGDDVQRGGAGDDAYVFNLGDGQDTIIDIEGTSTIVFGPGIDLASIRMTAVGGKAVLHYSDHDNITIDGAVQQYRFDDGSTASYEQVMALLSDPVSVTGSAGDDTVMGGSGNDALWGGAGDDILTGGAGNDYLYGEDGQDTLIGGAGNDTLFGQGGNDAMLGGDGADQLIGGDGDDVMHGDAGADKLWGQAGDDTLYGDDGNDELVGGTGNDLLVGGRGDDMLIAGGAGVTSYAFNIGDGNDVILVTANSRHVQFGTGVAQADIKLFLSPVNAPKPYVKVQYSAEDSVLIQLDAGNGPLDYQFADGTVLTHASLVALATQAGRAQYVLFGTDGADWLFAGNNAALIEGGNGDDRLFGSDFGDTLHGGGGNDMLFGSGGNNVLDGGSGNDTLNGSNGNDVLLGGAGDDVLNGSTGSDTYLYAKGDGSDVIVEEGNGSVDVNVLRLTDLLAADITYTHEAGGSLKLHVNGTADTIEIRSWYNSPDKRLQQIVYADGSVLDTATLNNLAQVQIVGLGEGVHLTGTQYSDIIVGTAGDDVIDGGAGNDLITGGAGSDTYLMRRGMGLDTVYESVGGVNSLKLAGGLTFDQLVTERKDNDLHVYFIGTSDGALLKDYFAGTNAWIVSTDAGEQKSIGELIAEINNRPVAVTVEQLRQEWVDQAKVRNIQNWIDDINYRNSSNQGYSATYTQPNPYELKLTNTYQNGAVSHTNFTFSDVIRQSEGQYIQRATDDSVSTTVSESTPVTVRLPASRFDITGTLDSGYTVIDYGRLDAGGNPVRFTTLPGGGLPADNFDPAIYGIGADGAVADEYVVQRQENISQAVNTIERIVAGATDDVVLTWGGGTVDGGAGDDYLYVQGGGDGFGQFLYGGAGDDFFTGGYDDDFLIGGDGDDYLTGNQGNDTYYLVANETGTKIIDEVVEGWYLPRNPDRHVVWNSGDRYSVDTVEFGAGIDRNNLLISRGRYANPYDRVQKTYDTLDFSWGADKSARVLLADPAAWISRDNDGYGIEYFKFADGTVLTMAEMKALADAPAEPENRAPEVAHTLTAQWAMQDAPFSFVVPGDTFIDADVNDHLAYSAKLATGDPLPSWLIFDAATRTFSGTPLHADVGNIDVRVTATDTSGASATDVFNIAVSNTNDTPIVANALVDQSATQNQSFSYVMPNDTFLDVDTGDTLTYSAKLGNGAALPDWLTFNPGTRTFSGTPDNAQVGMLVLKVIVADAAGAVVASTFNLNVINVNDAPTAIALSADTVAENTANATIGTFSTTDPDAGDTFTYSIVPGGDGAQFALSGNALKVGANALDYETGATRSVTVRATDQGGLTFEQTMTINVIDVNETPVNVIYGTTGNDTMYDGTGGNTLNGLGGDDIIFADAGDDVLIGGAGNDTLNGEVGNDLIDGGIGNDLLNGGDGNNIYLFGRGAGQDTIDVSNWGELQNRIRLGADVLSSDVTLRRVGTLADSDLLLSITGTTDTITVKHYFSNATVNGYKMSQIEFGDGSIWDRAAIVSNLAPLDGTTYGTMGNDTMYDGTGGNTLNGLGGDDIIFADAGDDVLIGGAGNDTLNGEVGNDTIEGGIGNDLLNGGDGNNIYLFGRGAGQDTIDVSNWGELQNRIRLGADVLSSDVILSRVGALADSDLLLSITGTADTITVKHYFAGGVVNGYKMNQIEFGDGSIWDRAAIRAHLAPLEGTTYGTTGNDTMYDSTGGNILNGLGGDDTLFGGAGDNILLGGDGKDVINDAGGNNVIDGGTGDDSIRASGDNIIEGGAGDDRITIDGGSISTNTIHAGDGNDVVSVSYVSRGTIDGGAGDDVLTLNRDYWDGYDSGYHNIANTFIGGTGNDTMVSSTGADTYVFNRGDGQDTITDIGINPYGAAYGWDVYNDADRIVFGAGITIGDIAARRVGADMFIQIKDAANPASADQLTVKNWFDATGYQIESVQFADGTSLGIAALNNLITTGTGDADILTGWFDQGVTFRGLGGNDTINAQAGNDTIDGGDGNDVINDAGGSNVIDGGAGNDTITAAGNNVIDGGAGDDSIRASGNNIIEGGAGDDRITIDGGSISTNTIHAGDGNDVVSVSYVSRGTIDGGAGDDVLTLTRDYWDGYDSGYHNIANTFIGGTGNDTMVSSTGADTYVFNRGDGQDTITDIGINPYGAAYGWDVYNDADRIVFGAGITIGNIAARRVGADMVIQIKDAANPASTDQLTVKNWFDATGYQIESVQFADGTSLDTTILNNMGVPATQGDDVLTSWMNDPTHFQGLGGNDTITNVGGNNLLDGGSGNDILNGGIANQLFIGGAGNDLVDTGAGNDIIAFNLGDGQDTVAPSIGKDNTLSLGNGIKYADLLFKKDANDLVLATGISDQVIFKDWYVSVNNHSIANLQIVIENTTDYNAASTDQLANKKVEQFDFDGLVTAFDQARAGSPALTSWALSSSLLSFYLNSSDIAAIGGDLAYQYARNGSLSNMSLTPTQALLASPQFGVANQNLQAASALQDLSPRLM